MTSSVLDTINCVISRGDIGVLIMTLYYVTGTAGYITEAINVRMCRCARDPKPDILLCRTLSSI